VLDCPFNGFLAVQTLTTLFSLTVVNFVPFFLLLTKKIYENSKMCLKQLFSYYKWVLQEISFLTVLSNCISVSSNFNTAFFPDYTNFSIVS